MSTLFDLPYVPNSVLAFDPGNVQTGWVLVIENSDTISGVGYIGGGNTPNSILGPALERLSTYVRKQKKQEPVTLVMEMMKPQGMALSGESMQTLVEIGEFRHIWKPNPWSYAFRQQIRIHTCGTAASKDKNLAQAMKDRWGGVDVAVGNKKCKTCHGKGWQGRDHTECENCGGSGWLYPPGPLANVTDHMWQALPIACAWIDGVLKETHVVVGHNPVKQVKKKERRR